MSEKVSTPVGVGSYVLVTGDTERARVVSYLEGATHPWLVRLADGQDVWAKASQLTWLVDDKPAAWNGTLLAELGGVGL